MNHNYLIRRRSSLLCGIFLLASPSLWAVPMGFKDSTMLMGNFSSNWRDLWVNHAVTPRDALARVVFSVPHGSRAARGLSQITPKFTDRVLGFGGHAIHRSVVCFCSTPVKVKTT